MKRDYTWLIIGLIIAIGGVVAGVIAVKYYEKHPVVAQVTTPERETDADAHRQPPRTLEAETPIAPAPPAGAQSETPAPARSGPPPRARARAPRVQSAPPQQPPPAEPIVPLPVARQALAFVGADSDALGIWVAAINDASFTANQRQDLIEDLNEEGFDDRKNVTEDDLPLIVNRLLLIEMLAPDAMDDVNAAAFQEAYKDLAIMYVRLTQQ